MGNGTTGKRKRDEDKTERERERESVLTSLSLCGVVFYFLLNPFFFLFSFSFFPFGWWWFECFDFQKRKLIEQNELQVTHNQSLFKLPCFFFYKPTPLVGGSFFS